MQYMGGKERLSKAIVEQLMARRGGCSTYLEPFMGGGSIFSRMAPHFPGTAIGSDVHEDLMFMWSALVDGWTPPESVSKKEWYEIKDQGPSALRGFVGFGCSFGGRWFEGYAKNARGSDFCGAARRGVLKKVQGMRGVTLLNRSYTEFSPGRGTLVYCDPPYASTKPYSGVSVFDSAEFWSTIRAWANNGAVVLVSEYNAPEWAVPVWERAAVKSLNKDSNTQPALERLYLVTRSSETTRTTSGDGSWQEQASASPIIIEESSMDVIKATTSWTCLVCGKLGRKGARVVSNGGFYRHPSCGVNPDVSPVIVAPQRSEEPASESETWQEQASAAAKRHTAALAAAPAADYAVTPTLTGAPVVLADASGATVVDEFVKPTVVKPEVNVSGQPASRRDYLGRYLVKDPVTLEFKRAKNGNVQGYTRVTTFVKAGSDSVALNDWQKRNVLIGAAKRPDIVASAAGMTHEANKAELARYVSELETAAGAKISADIGTKLHEFTELMDAGLRTWQDAPEMYQQQLYAYGEELRMAGFVPVPGMIERTVMVRRYGVVGKFDRVLLHVPSQTYVIGDLKTGKTLDYAMDEIQAQEWFYAEGINENGVYDWNLDRWEPIWEGFGVPNSMPPLRRVRTDVGLIIHMPVQGDLAGQVRLVKADLEAGAVYAAECAQKRARKRPPQNLWTDSTLPSERDWAHEFARVVSGAQAGALWEEARDAGVDPMTLQELVRIAQTVLASRG